MNNKDKDANHAQAKEFLRTLGENSGDLLPIAEAALAFAILEHAQIDPAAYHQHLACLVKDVERFASAFGTAEDLVGELGAVLAGIHGYVGDQDTYDDLDNADLTRVIERRRGLPVALGILYIHVARAQGWRAAGLAFPGHFLIEVEAAGKRAIIDPFDAGALCNAKKLRDLLRRVDPTAELSPAHYQVVSDRNVLLRLQNNIKARLLMAGDLDKAATVVQRMLLLAPENKTLQHELDAIRGNFGLG